MSMIPKEVVRELIHTEEPQSTQEVLDLLKEMFKDVLQGVLEAELDEHMGYEKNDKAGKQTENHRNGYFPKTVKSELGPIELQIPRDCKGSATKQPKKPSRSAAKAEQTGSVFGIISL